MIQRLQMLIEEKSIQSFANQLSVYVSKMNEFQYFIPQMLILNPLLKAEIRLAHVNINTQ